LDKTTNTEDCDPSFCPGSDTCNATTLCPVDNINETCKNFAVKNIYSNIISDRDEELRILNNVCSKDPLDFICTEKSLFLIYVKTKDTNIEYCKSDSEKGEFILNNNHCKEFCVMMKIYVSGYCNSIIRDQCKDANFSKSNICSCYYGPTTKIGKSNYKIEDLPEEFINTGVVDPMCITEM